MENFPNNGAPVNPFAQSQNTIPPQQPIQTAYPQPVYTAQYPPHFTNGAYPPPSYTPRYNPAPSIPAGQSPSAIYYANQNGAPQYHYGAAIPNVAFNNEYYEEQRKKFEKRREAEKKIRTIGNITGAILLAYLFISNMISLLFFFDSVSDFYDASLNGKSFFNMIYSFIVVGGTMLGAAIFLKKHAKNQAKLTDGVDVFSFSSKLSAPKNPLKTTLLIIMSFGGCMLANFFTNIIFTIFSMFGIYSSYTSNEYPTTIMEIIMLVVSTAVIPALIEEYTSRGILMSHMRRYGNTFAIFASAFFFGVMHGTAAQIPFAFICGLFFAYSVIASESLWTGIIIHALNNSLSCIYSVLMTLADEETADTFYSVTSIGVILLGIAAFLIYYKLYKDDGVFKFKGDANELTDGQKIGTFLKSPVLIVATAVYFIQSIFTLTTTPPPGS
ncbi:MAG: CPBP family intramembrane metalloprotease [Clostridia bacterium]|nr:CPBP family intramembrane metalloprotease [Clostridia bacterium]